MLLLDTDTLIYSLKGHERVVENLQINSDRPMAISVISYGELLYGAYKSARVTENLAKVHRIKDLFPVLEISPTVMETFGKCKADLDKGGVCVADMDLMIAATALVMGYRVVTNNTKHFGKVPGLELENWTKRARGG